MQKSSWSRWKVRRGPGDALLGDSAPTADRRPRRRGRRAAGRSPCCRRGRVPAAGRGHDGTPHRASSRRWSGRRPAADDRDGSAAAAWPRSVGRPSRARSSAVGQLPVPDLGHARRSRSPAARCRTARPSSGTRRTAGCARRSATRRTGRRAAWAGVERLLERAPAAWTSRRSRCMREEVAGLLDRRRHLVSPAGHRATPADQLLGAEARDRVQGGRRPLLVERVAGVERGLASTRSPAKRIRWRGSHATMSPSV